MSASIAVRAPSALVIASLAAHAVLPPSAYALAAPAPFVTENFSAENCVNGRALYARTAQIRASLAANGVILPALAASVFTSDGIVRTAVVGERNISLSSEDSNQARLDDAFAYGSVGKAWTSLALGALVDRGLLSFDTRLSAIFGSDIDPVYADVSVRQVIDFQSGVAPLLDSADLPDFFASAGADLTTLSQAEATQLAALTLLRTPPAFSPGDGQEYSNGDFVVAAAIVERLTGQSIQDVITNEVMEPVGAGFVPSVPALVLENAPLGHVYEDGALRPLDASENAFYAGLGTFLAGAGLAQAGSIGDYARVEQGQLAALSGDASGSPLSAATLAEIYTPPQGLSLLSGFGVADLEGAATYIRLGGDGANIAASALIPDLGVGAALMTNADIASQLGGPVGGGVADDNADIPIVFGEMLPAIADLAGRGIGAPSTSDESSIYQLVEGVCASSHGGESALVALFGEIPAEEAPLLAARIAPDDTRAALGAIDAALDDFALHLASAITPLGLASRRREQAHDGVRAFVYGGASRGDGPVSASERADVTTSLSGFGIERSQENIRVGASFAFGDAIADLEEGRGRASIDRRHLAAYGVFNSDSGVFADAIGSWTSLDVRTVRRIASPSVDLASSQAERSGWAVLLDGRVGYASNILDLDTAFFAGLRYRDVRLDGTAETGSLASLELGDIETDSLQSRLGVAFGYGVGVGDWRIAPFGELAHVHILDQNAESIRARVAGAPEFADFVSPALDHDWGETRFGLTLTRGTVEIGVDGALVFDREDADRRQWSIRGALRF